MLYQSNNTKPTREIGYSVSAHLHKTYQVQMGGRLKATPVQSVTWAQITHKQRARLVSLTVNLTWTVGRGSFDSSLSESSRYKAKCCVELTMAEYKLDE